MGSALGKYKLADMSLRVHRSADAVSHRQRKGKRAPSQSWADVGSSSRKDKARRPGTDDRALLKGVLNKLLLFNDMDDDTVHRIIHEMYEMPIAAGEALRQQGDSDHADKLFVLKSGKFEVLCERDGLSIRVNCHSNSVYGEASLMYDCTPSASVVAVTDASAWVLERDTFRSILQTSMRDKHAARWSRDTVISSSSSSDNISDANARPGFRILARSALSQPTITDF